MAIEQKTSGAPYVPIGNPVLWCVGLLLYYCWFQAFYNALKFGEIFPYQTPGSLVFGLTCNLLPIALVWYLDVGIVFRWIRFRDRRLKIIADITAAGMVAVCVNWLFGLLFTLVTGWRAHIDWNGTLLNDLLVLMFIEISFYFKSIILYQREMEDMRQEVMRYKYDSLKAQVNPHFLFNSFNLLYSLVMVNPLSARSFVENLAEMYRYVLDRHGRDRISASEELAFIKAYTGVLTTRYSNKFSVRYTGLAPDSEFLSEVVLIPFSLQILVENVVKHNVVSSRTPIWVDIQIDREGITVSNPMQPRKKRSERSSGFGLNYLKSVYENSGRQFRVIEDRDRGTFEVHLQWLPSTT